jgi:Tfp pilus assembly protein PilO
MNIRNQNITRLLTDFYQKPVAQVSVELVFSIVAVIVFAVFAIRPTLLTMSDLIKEMNDKETLNQALIQKVASLSSAQAQYANIQDQLAVLDQAIPPTPRLGEAVAIMEKLASEDKLLIKSLQSNEVPREDSTATGSAEKTRISKPITITVEGDYPTIRKFVTDLQGVRRAFVIDSVVFSLTDEQGAKTLNAGITVNLQYFGNGT